MLVSKQKAVRCITKIYSPFLKGLINSIKLGCEGQFIVEKNGKYGVVSENRNIAIVSFDGYNYLYDFVKEKKLKRLEEIKIEEAVIAIAPDCD